MSAAILFDPFVPAALLPAAAAVALLLITVVVIRRGRGWLLRALAIASLLLALANPNVLREHRQPRPDTAVVVVDDSLSQSIGSRRTETEDGLAALEAALAALPDLTVQVVRSAAGEARGETRLFAAAERALQEERAERLAAVFLLTDGQVHDTPASVPAWLRAPLHVLLTGAPGEIDRRIGIDRAPAFGLINETVEIAYRIEDLGVKASSGTARVRIRVDGNEVETADALADRPLTVQVPLRHAGPTVVEFEAEPLQGEVSDINNRAAVVINGVRDRLRVLLISGQPHPGERTWRNLLKSDPAVDLVHFTILRPPDKDDATPLRELSLIVFPVQELFEDKLNEFDLLIFDRYVVRGILPNAYFERIANYVRQGGAMLVSVGPEYAGPYSIFRTPLADVLPVRPTGRIFEQAFRPQVTAIGRRHPVTSGLPGESVAGDAGDDEGGSPAWGQWFRTIDGELRGGNELMTDAAGRPLLVLDKVDEGRVAQLLSDQIWLWARGYDGGGPHAELLRRLAHWLMKEPELAEESLKASVVDDRLKIARRSLEDGNVDVTVTGPEGLKTSVTLIDGTDGIARGEMPVHGSGLYRIEDSNHTAFAASGRVNPPELSDLRATAERLHEVASRTGGGIAWLSEGLPELRRTAPGRDAAGRGWLGLKRNEATVLTGVTEVPLLPAFVLLTAALVLLAGAWWREGR